MMSACRISVLGPVRAWRHDRELLLGPPQQRAILALLAVAGGGQISTGSLVQALWPEAPPPSAVNVVQTYLKRLRQLLDPDRPARAPSTLLPRLGNGYALRVAPDAVDLWRFRTLLREARDARRAGTDDRARGIVAQALALWQGPPASDVPAVGPRLRAVTEERWAAVGWYAAVALATGDPREALPAVADGAAARPLDESLQAHLVRLLHAVGRRGEAAQVYHQARVRLRDELGFDPGQELTAAYRDLLRDDARVPVG